MVKIMENPIKMDDLGGNPPIFWNIHMVWKHCFFFNDRSFWTWTRHWVKSTYEEGLKDQHDEKNWVVAETWTDFFSIVF